MTRGTFILTLLKTQEDELDQRVASVSVTTAGREQSGVKRSANVSRNKVEMHENQRRCEKQRGSNGVTSISLEENQPASMTGCFYSVP